MRRLSLGELWAPGFGAQATLRLPYGVACTAATGRIVGYSEKGRARPAPTQRGTISDNIVSSRLLSQGFSFSDEADSGWGSIPWDTPRFFCGAPGTVGTHRIRRCCAI